MKTTMTTQVHTTRTMRTTRRRLRLRQLDLARRVGCTESMITRIETGRCTPDDWLKEAIARELGINTWEVGA